LISVKDSDTEIRYTTVVCTYYKVCVSGDSGMQIEDTDLSGDSGMQIEDTDLSGDSRKCRIQYK
jgi:hypothetical protein